VAKLYLTFEGKALKEIPLAHGDVTIGRLPDNVVHIDNLAVSGHHAHIFWETDHYVIEDQGSLNGTYVNKQRATKVVLKDGDHILVGKHELEFKDEWHEDTVAAVAETQPSAPVPSMGATMMLDTKKAKEMMAAAAAGKAAAATAPPAPAAGATPAEGSAAPTQVPSTAIAQTAVARERIGMVTVLSGKTDQPQYILTGKLTVVGKSAMASIKIKGWFVPQVAAMISKRDNKYFIAAQDKNAKLKVNGADVAKEHGLEENDVIDVAGIKLSFGYHE
jgi:predicted component of type VI protein secretion system